MPGTVKMLGHKVKKASSLPSRSWLRSGGDGREKENNRTYKGIYPIHMCYNN